MAARQWARGVTGAAVHSSSCQSVNRPASLSSRTQSPEGLSRAHHSCEPCRKHKLRCVPDAEDQRQPCRRYVADGQPERCGFSDTGNTRRRLSGTSLVAAVASPSHAGDVSLTMPACSPAFTSLLVDGAGYARHGGSSLFGRARDADEVLLMQRLPPRLSGNTSSRAPSSSSGRRSPLANPG
jgi:hypothetical protein